MNASPSFFVQDKKICTIIRYELNPVFRAFFKTASWNAKAKHYEAAYTPQNLRKWESFLEAVVETSEALDTLDEVEASEEMLKSAEILAQRAFEEINLRIKNSKQRSSESVSSRLHYEQRANELRPLLAASEMKLAELLITEERCAQEFDATIAPVLELYKLHDLTSIFSSFDRVARRGHVERQTFEQAQECLRGLTEALMYIGYRCEALDQLVNVSLNRHDKVKDMLAQARMQCRTEIMEILPSCHY